MNNTSALANQEEQLSSRLLQLSKMLAVDSANKTLRSQCVALALQERQFDFALKLAADALALDSNDLQSQFEKASALIGKREFSEAIEVLQPLTLLPEVPPAVWQNIGLCHYIQGDFVAARSALVKVYESGVRTPDLIRLLISSLHHLGDVEQALAIANEAGELGRADGALAGVLALLYLDASEPALAARWSARAVAANPDSIDGLVVQGTLRTASFDLSVARQQFNQVLAKVPNTARAWVGLSMISLAENDMPQARKQIEQGLNYMPEHVGSWHVLAWIHLLQGNLNEAGATFERALQIDRNFAESHGGLAAVAAMAGDKAKAEHLIEIAERLDPKCLSAKFARSTLLRGTGNNKEAKDTLVAALTGLSPGDGGAVSRIIKELTQR